MPFAALGLVGVAAVLAWLFTRKGAASSAAPPSSTAAEDGLSALAASPGASPEAQAAGNVLAAVTANAQGTPIFSSSTGPSGPFGKLTTSGLRSIHSVSKYPKGSRYRATVKSPVSLGNFDVGAKLNSLYPGAWTVVVTASTDKSIEYLATANRDLDSSQPPSWTVPRGTQLYFTRVP